MIPPKTGKFDTTLDEERQTTGDWAVRAWKRFRSAPVPLSRKSGEAPECIFVTGVMRSGTTLLQRVIAHSCATDYIREECSLRIPVESFELLERHQAFQPIGRTAFLDQYRRFLSGLLAAMRDSIGGDILVIKDPLALATMATCHELMPRAKFVISIRNPLATAASIYRVRNRQREQGKKSFITPMDFGDIVVYIAKLCDVIIGLHDKNNVCLVQYEGLIGRDPVVLARLRQFLGTEIRFDLGDDTDAYDPGHAFWTPESGAASTLASSLDKYETELTQAERALVLTKLARFNTMFGYNQA